MRVNLSKTLVERLEGAGLEAAHLQTIKLHESVCRKVYCQTPMDCRGSVSNAVREGRALVFASAVHGSSLEASSLCFSQSSRSLVSRSDWEMCSRANAPVSRSS